MDCRQEWEQAYRVVNSAVSHLNDGDEETAKQLLIGLDTTSLTVIRIIEVELKWGKNFEALTRIFPPQESSIPFLEIALRDFGPKELTILKDCGVDILGKIDEIPALHIAACRFNVEAVDFLLNQGADVTTKDTNGDNALESIRDSGNIFIGWDEYPAFYAIEARLSTALEAIELLDEIK